MNVEYTVERTISDAEFSESYVEEVREDVKKRELFSDGPDPSDEKIERLVREELEEVAKQMMLESQGHNDLHRAIEIGSAEKK
jgi:hypothetical protein